MIDLSVLMNQQHGTQKMPEGAVASLLANQANTETGVSQDTFAQHMNRLRPPGDEVRSAFPQETSNYPVAESVVAQMVASEEPLTSEQLSDLFDQLNLSDPAQAAVAPQPGATHAGGPVTNAEALQLANDQLNQRAIAMEQQRVQGLQQQATPNAGSANFIQQDAGTGAQLRPAETAQSATSGIPTAAGVSNEQTQRLASQQLSQPQNQQLAQPQTNLQADSTAANAPNASGVDRSNEQVNRFTAQQLAQQINQQMNPTLNSQAASTLQNSASATSQLVNVANEELRVAHGQRKETTEDLRSRIFSRMNQNVTSGMQAEQATQSQQWQPSDLVMKNNTFATTPSAFTQQWSANADNGFQLTPVANSGQSSDGLFASLMQQTNNGSAVQQANATPTATPQNMTSGQLSAQLNTQAWNQQLGQHLVKMAIHNQQNISLRLHPADLGPLMVNLQMDEQGTQLQLFSQNAQVRAALEQALPHLRDSLAEQGIELGQSNVSDEQPSQFGEQPTQQPNLLAGDENTTGTQDSEESTTTHVTLNRPGIDLYA